MTFVITKAKVGYIVRPESMRAGTDYSPIQDWAAFDSWEQASVWIGEQLRALK
jgi:hypothetical protein